MPTVSPAFTFSGVVTSLAKKSVAAATSFSATLDSIAGVNSVAWSIVGTDETTTAGTYTLTPSGTKGETVTLTSAGAGTAGILSVTVNGGVDPRTGSASTDMTASAKFYVPLADGGEVGCVGETTQSSTFGWTLFVNQMARRLSGLGTTVSLSAITVPAAASFAYSQAQHASAAGNTSTWTGQAGATGFDGGGFAWTGGAGGGADKKSGGMSWDLGPEDTDDDKTASAVWKRNGTTFLSLYSENTTAVLDAGAGPLEIRTTGVVSVGATGGGSAIFGAAGATINAGPTFLSLSGTNIAVLGAPGFGSGTGVIAIANRSAAPSTNPTGGGILYAEGGAGKWRGSSGTVTTFAPADPHCPSCDRDFAHEWTNDRTGEHLAVCVPCMIAEMSRFGMNVGAFAFIKSLK